MAIDVPQLDDREYDDIIEDAVKEIQIHTDQWTDHNAHDPGITILELLSWIAETYTYQLDQITDAHTEKYLELLGVRPRRPRPAFVPLRLSVQRPADAGKWIDIGEKVLADDGTGVTKMFQMTEPITLTAATVERVLSSVEGQWIDNSTANGTDGMFFLPFGTEARQGSIMDIGFAGDPFARAETLHLQVDFHEQNLPSPASHGKEQVQFHPSAAIEWQHCVNPANWGDDSVWAPIPVKRDETRSLYEGGTVVLEKPDGWAGTTADIHRMNQTFAWIRGRIKTAGHEIPPQVDSIDVNVVTAHHRATVEDETLHRIDGNEKTTARPGQRFVFANSPVLDASVSVGGDSWKQVSDFDASNPDDKHFVLRPAQGEIIFGDNVRGAVPEAGQAVVATSYAYGGGTAGNVPQSTSWRFHRETLRDDVKISATDPARGGTEAESIDAALLRLQRDMNTPYRAVSVEDYEYVAVNTPGLRFGRAKAIVIEGEDVSCCEGHNRVKVIVVPYSTREKPVPSEGFLDTVHCHLRRHKLLTDRVSVHPPTYVGVGVTTEISLEEGYTVASRTAAIEEKLDSFLNPQEGFDGGGWPFGRDVHQSEIYEVIQGVDGIDCVLDVSLRAENARLDDSNILVDDTALVYPLSHDIIVRSDHNECRRWP